MISEGNDSGWDTTGCVSEHRWSQDLRCGKRWSSSLSGNQGEKDKEAKGLARELAISVEAL